jgi:hypothetical protein
MFYLKNLKNTNIKPQMNRQFQNSLQKNKYVPPKVTTIVLVGIFKNEGHILKEWIEHYIKEGVDMFCLIDNGSTDNYIEKIKEYIHTGKVVLNVDHTKHQQTNLYNKYYLNLCKLYTWVIVVDLDEFMYSRNGFRTIKEYLSSLNDSISRIEIPWKMYGSNGFIEQPDSVIQNFNVRQEYTSYEINNFKCTDFIKCIVRGNKLKRLDIHNSYLIDDSTHINSFKQKTEEDLTNMNIHLNHYAIQSLEYFKNVKMTRGAADQLASEHVRNMEYFQKYDHKDIIDEELKNKIY